MTDTNQFDEQKEFDSILAAVSSGDHAGLNKLMESEPNANAVVQETTEEPEAVIEEAPEPVVETTGEETTPEPVAVVTPEAVEQKDTKADIPEDVQAEIERLRQEVHKYKSDAGRVPFTQKRIQEMERELATLRASKAAESSTSESGEVELDAETKAVIDELRVTDPVMAKALETVAKKAVSTATTKVTSAFNEYSKTTQEADDDRYFAEQYSMLTSQIPQAPQIFASNEWKQWKQSLTPNRRAMAESVHAEEVATAIYAFAADMQRSGVQTPPVQQQAPAAPAAPEQSEAVQKAIQERNRKVANAAEVTTTAARATEEFDEEKAYLDMYNKIAKANHIK